MWWKISIFAFMKNDKLKNKNLIAFENEVSTVDTLGSIRWKHRELVLSLMPVKSLELPKDLCKFLSSDIKIDPEDEQ